MPNILPDIDRLEKICKKYKIKLVKIATNMLGQKQDNIDTPTQKADMFILTINKQLSDKKIADIAFVLTQDETTAQKLYIQKSNGLPMVYQGERELDYLYDVQTVAHDFHIDILSVIYNLSQIEKYEAYMQKRVEIAKIYCEKLRNLKHITIKKFDKNLVYSEFIIEVDKNRDAFARELKTKGITTGLHYIPLHLLSYYKEKYSYKIDHINSDTLSGIAFILSTNLLAPSGLI